MEIKSMKTAIGMVLVVGVVGLLGCDVEPTGPRVIKLGDDIEMARRQFDAYGYEETYLQFATGAGKELAFWRVENSKYLLVSYYKNGRRIAGMNLLIFSKPRTQKAPEEQVSLESFDLVGKKGVGLNTAGQRLE